MVEKLEPANAHCQLAKNTPVLEAHSFPWAGLVTPVPVMTAPPPAKAAESTEGVGEMLCEEAIAKTPEPVALDVGELVVGTGDGTE